MSHRFRYVVLLWLSVLAGCSLVTSDAAPEKEYRVVSERSDRLVVVLDNRLIVIAQEIHTAPVVSVQAHIKTGSIYEGEHNGAGLSHFLEHLISGGTTSTRAEAESSEMLGRIGAQTNASTGLDTVRYYINTAGEHTDTAIDLISDWMQNSLITQTEYERERDVIQREFEMGRADPGRIFWKLTQQARYTSHPARHPTIGYLDEFLQVSRDEIYAFYKKMYVPNNIVMVVAGDIDKQAVVDRVTERWSAVQQGQLDEVVLPVEREISQAKEMTGHADVRRPRLRLAWPGTRLAAEHDYALDLLGQILGQGELSRLVQTVRNEQQLVTSIDAYNLSFSWGEGFFGVDAVTTAEQLDHAKAAILEQVERVRAESVDPEELARAKQKTLAHVVYAGQTAEGAASRLAGDLVHMGDPDYLKRYAEAIQAVTADEVKAAADALLSPDRLITAKLLPLEGESDQLQRPADSAPATESVEHVSLDNTKLVESLTKLAQAESVDASVQVTPTKLVRLPNGLRVLIQRNTQLPLVAMQWYHLGGLLADEAGNEGVANAMCQMMIKGAAGRSADDIARTLEDLGAEMSTRCGNSTFYVSAQCLADDWPTVLQLMADVMQRPDFSADQWQKMQPRLLAAIDTYRDRWYSHLSSEFRQAYFGDHPWSQPVVGRRPTVEQLTPEMLKQFHRQHIAAADGVLAVFGDLNEQQVIAEVTRLFADMPAKAPVPFARPTRQPAQVGYVPVQSDKPVVAVQLGYGPGLARNNDDYGAMLVMTRLLSQFPGGRLHQALRGEGPGLAYAVWAYPQTGIEPGFWAIVFNTSPATVPEAIRRSVELVGELHHGDWAAKEVERARTATLVEEALGSQSNGQRAMEAALGEVYGVGYQALDQLIDQINRTDGQRIGEVARRYLRRPTAVILSPEPVDISELPALEPTGADPAQPSPDG